MFPVIRKRGVKKSSMKSTEQVPVYCKCRMPELPGERMIECVLIAESGMTWTVVLPSYPY